MQVDIYELFNNGPQMVGSLVLQGNQIVPQGDSPSLLNVLKDPIILRNPRRRVTAQENPQEFLEGLCQYYKGSYFWASPPKE